MKTCEVCGAEIPADFVNALCSNCYGEVDKENQRLKAQEEEVRESVQPAPEPLPTASFEPINGITDPNYQENPEAEDKEQWETNIAQFRGTGKILWHPTRNMYEFIKNYCRERALQHPQYPKFVWKPQIVDVGCGVGLGSNILSQEADVVWGIDKNVNSIKFAKEAFTRIKNNIYYCPQLTYDVIDIISDNRTFAKFDIVVAIEIIEHISDYKTFLKTLIEKFDRRRNDMPTEYFISTPNRNNRHIAKDKPFNSYHVREWTQEEFHAVLSEFFERIEFFKSNGESVGDENNHTPLLAKCSGAKI